MRLDRYLYEQGLAKSRTEAARLIEAGAVTVAGTVRKKPSFSIEEDTPSVAVSVAEVAPFVSRGGEKLAAALGVTPTYLTGWEEERPHTLAAHFEGEEFSEDELREIEKFVQFVKSRRNQ